MVRRSAFRAASIARLRERRKDRCCSQRLEIKVHLYLSETTLDASETEKCAAAAGLLARCLQAPSRLHGYDSNIDGILPDICGHIHASCGRTIPLELLWTVGPRGSDCSKGSIYMNVFEQRGNNFFPRGIWSQLHDFFDKAIDYFQYSIHLYRMGVNLR